MEGFSFRRFASALAAFVVLEIAGTIGYHQLTSEGWIASLYRSVVTTTLTGIDTQPPERAPSCSRSSCSSAAWLSSSTSRA